MTEIGTPNSHNTIPFMLSPFDSTGMKAVRKRAGRREVPCFANPAEAENFLLSAISGWVVIRKMHPGPRFAFRSVKR